MKSLYYHYSTALYLQISLFLQRCQISSFLPRHQAIVLCLSPQIHSLLTPSRTLFLYHPLKTGSSRKVILSNTWTCLPTRDMLSGEEIRSSLGILGGARSSIRPKLMINLVTFPGRKQRGRRSGRILSKVLISRMVLRRLSARHVGRYLLTLSCGLVAVVHLLFGVMPSTRNVVAQKLVKDSCRNLE